MSSPNPPSLGPLDSIVTIIAYVGFSAIGVFNACELLIKVFVVFERYSGSYFWSLVTSASGVLIYLVFDYVLDLSTVVDPRISVSAISIGWIFMVTGQALVLWSRLHLVVRSPRKLRLVLGLIIFNACTWHPMQFVLGVIGAGQPETLAGYEPFEIGEKVSMAMFSAQEALLSSIYIVEIWKLLKPGDTFMRRRTRKSIIHLIIANMLILALDITLLFLEIFSFWGVWCSFKGMSYTIKLQLEFHILNQLRQLTTNLPRPALVSTNKSTPTSRVDENASTLFTRERTSENGGPFSAYASISYSNAKPKPIDDGRILRTTEITIEGNHIISENEQIELENADLSSAEKGLGYSQSRASSVVKFAVEGA